MGSLTAHTAPPPPPFAMGHRDYSVGSVGGRQRELSFSAFEGSVITKDFILITERHCRRYIDSMGYTSCVSSLCLGPVSEPGTAFLLAAGRNSLR